MPKRAPLSPMLLQPGDQVRAAGGYLVWTMERLTLNLRTGALAAVIARREHWATIRQTVNVDSLTAVAA